MSNILRWSVDAIKRRAKSADVGRAPWRLHARDCAALLEAELSRKRPRKRLVVWLAARIVLGAQNGRLSR